MFDSDKLETLSEVSEPDDLRVALPMLVDRSERVRQAAMLCVARVAASIATPELPRFDERLREFGRYAWPSPNTPEHLRAIVTSIDSARIADVDVLGMLTSHPSGFVREAAVTRLAAINDADGRELRYLLLRANDWVDAVATLATEAVRARCVATSAPHVARVLDLVVTLERSTRRACRKLALELFRFVRETDLTSALDAIASMGDRARRRALDLLSTQEGGPADLRVIDACLRDRDPGVRRLALSRFPDPRSDAGVLERLHNALADPVPIVRVTALGPVVECGPPAERAAIVAAALWDRSRSVRALAVHLDRAHGLGCKPVAMYRAALSTDAPVARQAVALRGLADFGAREDVELFRSFARHEHSRLRAVAIAGLVRFDPAGCANELIAAYQDDATCVRREAFSAARNHRVRVSDEDVRKLALDSPNAAVREIGLRLLRTVDKWMALDILLRALAREPRGSKKVAAHLDRWDLDANSRFNPLDAARRRSLLELLDELAPSLPKGFAGRYRALLRRAT